jgi:hypothetical protein
VSALVTRRALLAGAIGTAGLGVGLGWHQRFAVRLYFAFQQDGSRPALEPCEPGRLAEAEKDAMWRLAGALSEHWRLGSLTRAELDEVLDLKTLQPPSYLAEYRGALARLGEPSIEAVLGVLTSPRREGERFTGEAHVQSHVIEELVRLLLSRGGFQQFGLANHPGFFGGPAGYRQARSP